MLNDNGDLFVFHAKTRSYMIPRLTDALKGRPINSSDVSTLITIHDHPGCNIKDICIAIAADKGRQTNIVQHLIELKLVDNRSDNKKSYSLYLTDAGMEEYNYAHEALVKLNNALMINMTERQKETFKKLMAKIEEIADLGYKY